MQRKFTTSAKHDYFEMLGNHTARITATVPICHTMTPSEHQCITDELETDVKQIQQKRLCLPGKAIYTLRAEFRYEE